MQPESHTIDNIDIPVVLCTGRVDRRSEHVARYIYTQISKKDGIEATQVDIRDCVQSPFTIPAWVEDESTLKWRKIAQSANGFVFVVPEYNHSFPGEFKLLLDSASKEYNGKSVIIVGVSSGPYGGVRAIEHLTPVLNAVGLHVLPAAIITAYVKELFDDKGEVSDAQYIESVDIALDALKKDINGKGSIK